ncbi:sensor histidine kinase [Ferruginibacter sp.]|nr:histidine kinase [Ferruginibacter sp.]
MKRLLNKIRQNGYFFLFILLFAYIQSIYSRILIRGDLNIYIFTPEAAFAKLIEVYILFLVFAFFIRYWQESEIFTVKEMVKIFGTSIIVYLVIIQIIGLLISVIFGNIQNNFNWETVSLSSLTHLLDGFIYGSFILAYYYFHKNKKHQEQSALYNQALSESRINQLKTQLNPHFLFNNLNVLDQLIEEDKYKASEFLNEFADIYRYVLQASDRKLVPVCEELAFAERYFKLIQHKYGIAYQLKIERSGNGYIVPLTMQLLIENAVQHNLGSTGNPVLITIEVTNSIYVSNSFIPKRNSKLTSGRALQNIIEQYKLLTHKPIEIHKSDNEFSIVIPIIQSE